MKTVSLVEEAERRMRDWINDHKMKPGEGIPSGPGFARDLGVGYYAYNRALGLLIAEGVIQRDGYKLSLSKEGGVGPMLVHLVIPRGGQIAGYKKIARALGIRLVVRSWIAIEEVPAILDGLSVGQASGVICILPPNVHEEEWLPAVTRLGRRGMPVVVEGVTPPGVPSVGVGVARGVTLAIEHLAGLGHRELGFVTTPSVGNSGFEILNNWRGQCARMGLETSVERIHFEISSLRDPDDLKALAELLAGPWRAVTGLVLRATYDSAIERFMLELTRRSRPVPRSLSLVVLGNAPGMAQTGPGVTEVSVDFAVVQEMSLDLLRREVRKSTWGRPASSVQVLPHLIVRGSTAVIGGSTSFAAGTAAAVRGVSDKVPPLVADKEKNSIRTPGGMYPLAARASLAEVSRFLPIDLKPYVNRPLNYRRGWLGDLPLRCLKPGMHEIHGVPFRVLGGPAREGGVIVFHSAVNSTGLSHRLPDRLVIPIQAHVEAVYILHGCGYARNRKKFASYRFVSSGGELETVPLVSQGRVGVQDIPGTSGKAGGPQANIQDWWSDFNHEDFPHARAVPLLEGGDQAGAWRHVYLYTLEWINPRPGRKVRHLEIRVDPSVSTTLGVLAITAVSARR
ncbi:MAG: hypothetical protein K0R17_3121 [Rariglobus sp.]|jgi:DNA-binding LacI/PurR family transcriptional regulator|nr:hypothetical protein [Rariglobus sp.]